MIVGVVLAAGRGGRFGADKRLAELDTGEPMALVACRNLRLALDDVVAVVRTDDEELSSRLRDAGARVVACANSDRGMGASLACGVGAAPDAGGWVIALADMPWVEPATIARVAEALRAGASIAALYHDGRRGHPVGFSARHREALLALSGDEGARDVVRAHAASLVRIEVEDAGVLRDVDRPGDLAR